MQKSQKISATYPCKKINASFSCKPLRIHQAGLMIERISGAPISWETLDARRAIPIGQSLNNLGKCTPNASVPLPINSDFAYRLFAPFAAASAATKSGTGPTPVLSLEFPALPPTVQRASCPYHTPSRQWHCRALQAPPSCLQVPDFGKTRVERQSDDR